MTDQHIDHGFLTIRLLTEKSGAGGVPVGVAAWDASRRWFDVRLLTSKEKARSIPKARLALAEIAQRDLQTWAQRQRVPYASQEAAPWESEFWRAAHEFMSSGVRLDPPTPMEPMSDPDEEFPLLFEAVAKPKTRDTRRRIGWYLNEALGKDLGDELFKRAHVPAFRGRSEKVDRVAHGPGGYVLIEGVNLAAKNARYDADAMVSRLERILDVQTDADVLVGYVASPGGLNGEADMLEWIRTRVAREAYNLVRERRELRQATKEALFNAGLAPSVGFGDQLD